MTKQILLFLFALLMGSVSVGQAAEPAALEPGMVNPGQHEKPHWFKESFLDIRDDISEAKASNKRLVLYFYQDGCPYCAKLLKDNFGDAAIAEKAQQHFDIIAINMWGDRSVTSLDGQETTEKAFAASLQVQYTPTLLFLDESGKVILRVNGYYAPAKFSAALDYVAGKHEGEGSFREFFAQQSAKAVADNSVTPAALPAFAGSLPQPLRLADALKENGRALLVVFGQALCAECDELYKSVFTRKEVGFALSNLDVAQLDMQSDTVVQTPDGRELKASEWAKELDIKYSPSLVFFAADGKEVFRTEAYLKSFHIHGAIDYVVSGAYQKQPAFQRFLQHRTEVLRARGFEVDLME